MKWLLYFFSLSVLKEIENRYMSFISFSMSKIMNQLQKLKKLFPITAIIIFFMEYLAPFHFVFLSKQQWGKLFFYSLFSLYDELRGLWTYKKWKEKFFSTGEQIIFYTHKKASTFSLNRKKISLFSHTLSLPAITIHLLMWLKMFFLFTTRLISYTIE